MKRAYFGRNHVSEYWIVDVDARLIERWRPEDERPEVLAGRLVWTPGGGERAVEPFSLDLVSFFHEVQGEAD